jgi:hypothetical protein
MSSVKSEREDKETGARGDRALQLRESGLALWQVAARIGSSSASANGMIAAARRRREARNAPLAEVPAVMREDRG